MWPRNTADVTTLLPVIDRLRQRFGIGRVCVVGDRGMISAATIAGLEERRLEYSLGACERNDALVKKIVMENDDPLVPLLIQRQRGETQLFAKQVKRIVGKGDKERLVPLPQPVLDDLGRVWLTHRNRRWLFPNRHGDAPRTGARGPALHCRMGIRAAHSVRSHASEASALARDTEEHFAMMQ